MPNRDKRENRGGKRTPEKPAAVSGPGALSQRTDTKTGTNPSNPSQPVRHIPTDTYGESKQLTTQQQSAPMAAAPGQVALPTGQTNQGTGGVPGIFDPFANTEGPSLSQDTRNLFLDEPDMYLQELLRKFSHPDLVNLLATRPIRGMQ